MIIGKEGMIFKSDIETKSLLQANSAISTYHHWRCEFEPCSIQHYVIKFVSDLLQVGGFLRVLRFPPPIKLKYCWKWR